MRRPDCTEGQNFAVDWSKEHTRKPCGGGCFAGEGQTSANRDQRHEIVPANGLGLNLRVTTEIREALHEIVVNFWSRSGIADDEALSYNLCPLDLMDLRQRMPGGERQKYALGPKMGGITASPCRGPGNEGNVELELTYGGNMFCRVAIDQLDGDAGMRSVKGIEKVTEKT